VIERSCYPYLVKSHASSERWLKAELHSHCSLDPQDYKICDYSPEALIAEAARLEYDVLAVTCHDRDIWSRELSEYADSLGVTLIPGMEVTIEGRFHTLVYNFHLGPENLDTMAKIRAAKREDTLVIAPHAFFPQSTCLHSRLQRNLDVYDAVECSGFHTSWIDFNRRARRLAHDRRKPMVGNADVHFLWQLGKTFTWIYAEPDVRSVLNAVRIGRVRLKAHPLSHGAVARWWRLALWRALFPVNPAPTRKIGQVLPDHLAG
jgi:predicted metal-dependent phosphoesterase TrpH